MVSVKITITFGRCFRVILNLSSADELVDFNGIGTELLRFGDAWRQDPAFLDDAQIDAVRAWLLVAMDHFIWLDETEDGAIYTAEHLIEIFLIGGWPVSELQSIVTKKMNQPLFVCGLAQWLTRRMIKKMAGFAPDISAQTYLPQDVLQSFFAWINDPAFAARFMDVATSADADDLHIFAGQVAARRFIAISGQYNASLITPRR